MGYVKEAFLSNLPCLALGNALLFSLSCTVFAACLSLKKGVCFSLWCLFEHSLQGWVFAAPPPLFPQSLHNSKQWNESWSPPGTWDCPCSQWKDLLRQKILLGGLLINLWRGIFHLPPLIFLWSFKGPCLCHPQVHTWVCSIRKSNARTPQRVMLKYAHKRGLPRIEKVMWRDFQRDFMQSQKWRFCRLAGMEWDFQSSTFRIGKGLQLALSTDEIIFLSFSRSSGIIVPKVLFFLGSGLAISKSAAAPINSHQMSTYSVLLF